MEIIIGCITTAFGFILGLLSNIFFEIRNNKLKLVFDLQPDPKFITMPQYDGIKTNPSGMCLRCYNVGKVPFLFSGICIYCTSLIFKSSVNIPERELITKTLLPYECVTYPLNNQEYNGIIELAKKNIIRRCKIIAYSADNKKCKQLLDISNEFAQVFN